jgi:hypothetical protein
MPKLSKLYTRKQIDEIRQALIEKHGNNCALCKKPRSAFKKALSVDHEHKLGTIRGLLCYFDNKFLVGRFDIPKACKLMIYLIEYDNIEKNKTYLKELQKILEKALK